MELGWHIRYHHLVKKHDIPQLDKPIKAQLKKIIEQKLLIDPIRFGKPLQGGLNNERSLRLGKYRIVYDLDVKNTISVWAIQARMTVTKIAVQPAFGYTF